MLKLLLEQVKDKPTQENLQKLESYLVKIAPILEGEFKSFEYVFFKTGAQTLMHNLGFIPTDVIQTRLTGSGTIVYTDFTDSRVTITVGGTATVAAPTTLRVLFGRMPI